MEDEPCNAETEESIVPRRGYDRLGVIEVESCIGVELDTWMYSIGNTEFHIDMTMSVGLAGVQINGVRIEEIERLDEQAQVVSRFKIDAQ